MQWMFLVSRGHCQSRPALKLMHEGEAMPWPSRLLLPCTRARCPHADLFAKNHRESSIASAVTGWRPEAAVQDCRASGADFADRHYHSSQLLRAGRNSNFTLSAAPDRTELENLEVSATFRMGGRTQPLAAHVSGLGSMTTGPACSARSGSDAPVCASLEQVASAKSSPVLHAWVADDHQRSRLWTAARCPRTQQLDRRPPHVRGLGPYRRLSSMSPVSPGRHCWIRVACEACVGTCPWHMLWTASLHANQGWAVEENSVRRRFDLSRPALFFSNDRLFLSNDKFKWRSHEFVEHDRSCRCFHLHF